MTKAIHPKSYFSKTQLSIFLIVFAVLGLVTLLKSLAAVNPNLQGDLNNDNTVNITDLSILLTSYDTSSSSADINSDGTVGILDLSILLSHYGQSVSAGSYYPTDPSAACPAHTCVNNNFPRTAASCFNSINRNSTEVRTDNSAANNTMGDGSYSWSRDATDPYWALMAYNVSQVQGQFTGTTSEIFSWAACRWGIDEDHLRAVGVQESDWHQSSHGDTCGLSNPGDIGSFSIIQIKNKYCDGSMSWGGYPDTVNSTALALDFYGAYLRSCYDGVFYDGGSWLYGGKTVSQIAATSGWDYVLWGCIGSWFSGGWYDSGAISYINSVKQIYANKTWQSY